MTLIALPLALVIALLGIGLVVMDMERRELQKRRQILWGGCVCGAIAVGFLAPALHDGLYDAVFELLYGSPDHVLHPLEAAMPILLVGLLLTVLAGTTYGVGSRVMTE